MTPAEEPFETPGEAIAARQAGGQPGADGRWTVKRRWIPRLGTDTLWRRVGRRFRRVKRRADRTDDGIDAADVGAGCVDALSDSFAAAIVIAVVVLVVIFVMVPLVVAIVDVLLLLLLALGGLVARVLFRRPWLIEAHKGGEHVLRWRVVGWRASTERVAEIRQALAAGIVPPEAEVLSDPDHSEET